MLKGYSRQIRERIDNAIEGTIFISTDFSDITNTETARRVLNRLVKSGVIKRILNGMYEKPKYNKTFNQYYMTNPDDIAKTLSRCYNWSIAPCGNTALNLLGLSTQVPASWCYISDGPYKKYKIDSIVIEFKHRTNKDIKNLSYITKVVIEVLKTLGKANVSDIVINKLKHTINEEDKHIMLEEAKHSTHWIYKKICDIADDIK